MGLIGSVLGSLFGERNVVADTVEVFRENAEGRAVRQAELSHAALSQFASEFAQERRGRFDRAVDAINRLPRPALAMGTLGLFVSAMVAPIWFAERMQGIALVPEPLWWLLGGIVSFYFGARHQAKGQEFQRSIAATVGRAAQVAQNLEMLRSLDAENGSVVPAEAETDRGSAAEAVDLPASGNAAVDEWRALHAR